MKVNDLNSLANNSLSLGTGNGEALFTAFNAERSNISSPLDVINVASITSPVDVSLTRILHFNPDREEGGLIQLLFVFS